jgi:hypothetical protein
MAPGACVGLCADQGFKISGVESGFQVSACMLSAIPSSQSETESYHFTLQRITSPSRDEHCDQPCSDLHATTMRPFLTPAQVTLLTALPLDSQCFCGNSLDATKKVADSRCDVACSGDAKTLCGGNGFLNAYNLVPAPVSTSAVITTTVKPVSSTSKSAPAPSGTAPGCIGACDAEIGAPAPAAGARAALYAHHMVGNVSSDRDR